MDVEPEVTEYAELVNIWAAVQNGPSDLRLAVYRLLGPDLERWAIVLDGDVPAEIRRPVLDGLRGETFRSA